MRIDRLEHHYPRSPAELHGSSQSSGFHSPANPDTPQHSVRKEYTGQAHIDKKDVNYPVDTVLPQMDTFGVPAPYLRLYYGSYSFRYCYHKQYNTAHGF